VPRLRRVYGLGYLHFITFSCYRRLRFLDTARRRNLLLCVLEQVRRRYGFVVVGYVAMPEHVHLLVSEPERGNPGTVVQVLKQRFARAVLRELSRRKVAEQGSLWPEPGSEAHVWQARFYDFVVYTKKKRMEKLHYMHQNPVKRGLVLEAGQWRWSSFGDYVGNERGPVLVNEPLRAEMRVRDVARGDSPAA
jgi:putative transposase